MVPPSNKALSSSILSPEARVSQLGGYRVKPAGRASRGVTDLLERGQGEHRHLCFHNARRESLWPSPPATSRHRSVTMCRAHWRRAGEQKGDQTSRWGGEKEAAALCQRCQHYWARENQNHTGHQELPPTFSFPHSPTPINTFCCWFQTPFPPTQVSHTSLRSSDVTSNSLDIK